MYVTCFQHQDDKSTRSQLKEELSHAIHQMSALRHEYNILTTKLESEKRSVSTLQVNTGQSRGWGQYPERRPTGRYGTELV